MTRPAITVFGVASRRVRAILCPAAGHLGRVEPLLAIVVAVAFVACGESASPTAPSSPQPTNRANCSVTTVGLVPLADLPSGSYKGEPLGLDPGRTNTHPDYAAGLRIAQRIGPRNAAGAPDANGKYAFVSIGMSNTTMEFSTFKPLAERDPEKRPGLVVVDGAQGGQTAAIWCARPFSDAPWSVLDARLRDAGVTTAQVAVVWLKQADANPTAGWPAYAQALRDELAVLLRLLTQRFPNLEIAYLSSRTYAGYASTTLNPEPYAYESGFSVRWVIEDQLRGAGLNYDPTAGPVVAPWIAWGPYLWTDGMTGRKDGLTWSCSDVRSDDGTHPSTSGSQKVAQALLDFVHSDPTARLWFSGS